jgi:2-polyprenyl-3-methyl-5-hydroxy-6-metoxy-1,4-benzoquinol methylase
MWVFLSILPGKKVQIQSPVTLSGRAVKVYQFDKNRIREKYRELDIDISAYIGDKDITLWECQDTGYRFYYPFDIFGDGRFYEELQQKHHWYYTEGKFEHHKTVELLQPGQRVLEIGSGSGYFLGLCQQKGIHASGLEFNDEAISKCHAKGLSVEKAFIQDYAKRHAGQFDAVCFFQVLEHISDVHSFLEAAIATVKPGGHVIIAVPNNNPFLFKQDMYHALNLPPHHAGLWNQKTFKQLPRFFPLQLEQIMLEPLSDYKSWFLAQKNHFREIGSWKGMALSIIPRPVYKTVIRMASGMIEGRNILAIFQKK